MKLQDKVRYIARDIIKVYVLHVKNKVNSGNTLYISAGIDSDIDTYEELFAEVLNFVLGVDRFKQLKFNGALVADCASALDAAIDTSKYNSTIKQHQSLVYDTSMLLFRTVEKGLRDNGTKM